VTYIAPTVGKFKARFPEFSIVNDALVSEILDEAISAVGANWLEKDRALGQILLAAHNLAIEGEPGRSQATIDGRPANGPTLGAVTELKDRDAFVRLSDRAATVRAGSNRGDSGKAYLETPYGERYYKLLRKNVASVVCV